MKQHYNQHRFSGRPGAYCMKCGSADYVEFAFCNNEYDPFTDKWDTPEHKKEYDKFKYCEYSDKEWYDHLVSTIGKEKADIYFPDKIPIE